MSKIHSIKLKNVQNLIRIVNAKISGHYKTTAKTIFKINTFLTTLRNKNYSNIQ